MSSNELLLQTTLEGHTAAITVVEFSPDGRFLASTGDDGVVLIFSTSSWTPVCRFLDVSPRGPARFDNVKINGTFLPPYTQGLAYDRQQKSTVVQTSTFAGRIHSLSLLSTSPRIAIAYGNEVTLTDVIPNPYRLKENQERLPKPQAAPHGPNKSGGPIVKSLQFMRKKNNLVVTYTRHGIVYIPYISPNCAHWNSISIWDPHMITITGEIVPRTFLIGKSIIAMDDNIMAVSNLINGVDWYSLSDLAFLSTTKLPARAVFNPLSALTYSEDGTSVILGGANGSAHILGRDKGVRNLQHNGTSLPSH
ncbi:hypothetical protein BDM02DRAFT_3191787 [Thelephora ganbajun]|uniref:Uncharacterized protein n=1 Tax=Thelephora ganbajun TaxID=370292 RepID=A0ACB6Z1E5_THEGA|nr:hypothetical protein BDM02DRAFT_3191787 [Thelephora ganbajun]